MSEFTNAVMFDIDSTIRDTRQRHHLVPSKLSKKNDLFSPVHVHADWLQYSMACGNDAPMMGTIMIMRMSRALGWSNHLVSGCSEEARSITEEWLRKHDAPYDTLRLHTEHDIENNAEYKIEHARYLMSRGFELKLVVEDWPAVARLIEKELNVPVLVVNPCYDDPPMAEFEKSWVVDEQEVSEAL